MCNTPEQLLTKKKKQVHEIFYKHARIRDSVKVEGDRVVPV